MSFCVLQLNCNIGLKSLKWPYLDLELDKNIGELLKQHIIKILGSLGNLGFRFWGVFDPSIKSTEVYTSRRNIKSWTNKRSIEAWTNNRWFGDAQASQVTTFNKYSLWYSNISILLLSWRISSYLGRIPSVTIVFTCHYNSKLWKILELLVLEQPSSRITPPTWKLTLTSSLNS